MKTLWWRIRFAYSMCHIIWSFTPRNIKSAWEFSETTKFKKQEPYEAATREIGEWYL